MALLLSHLALADLVEMKNGDRYVGSVLALDERRLTLENDNLGTVHLPRAGVRRIHLGEVTARDVAASSATSPGTEERARARTQATGMRDLLGEIQQGGIDRRLIDQVQAQFLGAAGPEANRKFDSMLQGLLSGALSVRDLQGEARTATKRLRELKQDLGEDTGGMLDAYLGILENFLDRTESAGAESQPAPAARPEEPEGEEKRSVAPSAKD